MGFRMDGPGRRLGYPGSAALGPLYTRSRRPGDSQEATYERLYSHVLHRCEWYEDFLWDEAQVAAGLGQLYDLSPAGAPTLAVQSGVADGILDLKPAATSEGEILAYYWNDQLLIPSNKRWQFTALVNVVTAPASSAERIVIGVGSQQNNNLGAMTRNAWFRMEGSGAVKVETDDNTTDNDLGALRTAFTPTVGTYYLYRIDCWDAKNVSFQIAKSNGLGWREVQQLSAPAFVTSPGNLQPFVCIEKDSGTGVPEVKIDYLHLSWDRTG